MATNYTERKWEAQLEWSQVYRQEPRRLEKICRQPMFLMELRTLLLLLLSMSCKWSLSFKFPDKNFALISNLSRFPYLPSKWSLSFRFPDKNVALISNLSRFSYVCLASGLFPLGFPTKTLHSFLISPVLAFMHSPSHVALFHFRNYIQAFWVPYCLNVKNYMYVRSSVHS
jgi:hypothetical protein